MRWVIFMKVLGGQFLLFRMALINVVKVDVSYLFSASKVKIVRNTLRFLLLLILEINMMYISTYKITLTIKFQ
jgi:hypothetical protein